MAAVEEPCRPERWPADVVETSRVHDDFVRLSPDERASYGRPVGVAIGPDGSLLMADAVGNVIWRVTGEQQR